MPEQTPDPAWLHAMFGMEPKDAVAFLKSKGLAVTSHWGEMLDEAHARAFTVAKCAQLDVLQDIRSGLLDSLKNGKTFQQFKSDLEPLLKKKGWWGEKKVKADDGTEQTVQLGSPRRLKTIYQTNLQQAYMGGRMKAQMAAPSIEYLGYVAVIDSRTRPAHRALNGRVYRMDDPVWQSIYPSNGFGCRCRTRSLTRSQAEREGVHVEDSTGQIVTRTMDVGPDKLTGELFPTTQTGVRVKLEDGSQGIMWTAPGFNSCPLASHIFDEQLGRKALSALQDGPQAFKLVQDMVLSNARMKAWNAFLETTQKNGLLQGKTMTGGVLPFDVAKETGFAPVLHVEDRLFRGGKAIRHQAAGDGLSVEDWKDLPNRLRAAEWFIEPHTNNLVAVMDDGRLSAIFSKTGKADTVYFDAHIAQKIGEGMWRKAVP